MRLAAFHERLKRIDADDFGAEFTGDGASDLAPPTTEIEHPRASPEARSSQKLDDALLCAAQGRQILEQLGNHGQQPDGRFEGIRNLLQEMPTSRDSIRPDALHSPPPARNPVTRRATIE